MTHVVTESNIDELLDSILRDETEPEFIVVDLFCGAGGTTTGIDKARRHGLKVAKVIACVNHDTLAIKSHWQNHTDVFHFVEDIRTLDLTNLIRIVAFYRMLYPNARLILWASLESTNFSKAKGGQPRDADSRTLADHLERYIVALKPDYIQIENVVKFMSWGPLGENGKPVSRKEGKGWLRWRREICSIGYRDEWKELNSANFGAYMSRNRLFGIFARPSMPIVWPEPTHSKNTAKGSMFISNLQKWKVVKDVLDFADEGESIFNRKKPLSDKTLERIYAGLVKYVAKGDKAFLSKYFSGKPKGKVNSVETPGPTVTTFGSSALIQTKSFSDLSVDQPAGAITCKDHHALVQPVSLLKYNSTDKNGKHTPPSLEEPCPVVAAQSKLGVIQAEFLACYYGKGDNVSSTYSRRRHWLQRIGLRLSNHSTSLTGIMATCKTSHWQLRLAQSCPMINTGWWKLCPSSCRPITITNLSRSKSPARPLRPTASITTW
ncbi:cytosine-specific DNA methyltransferase [Flavihumibacter petaseus NBRC 106054]|uniref:DNA (cytosine-5-)-methyltransferase n=2 Tax=Flavihumibacter TaxID=1004301 RepID=A0A0E9MX47_9BACT|nr:cytosine-specific DNA methyltransferase [Flavihumibacter petaseus NBRC 106054]